MPACLGLDYGLRRIGVAASDSNASLALALDTHVEGRDGSVLTYLENLVRERAATTVVVGLPLTAEGVEAELAIRARAFATRLGEHLTAVGLSVAIVLWDERYSSQEADRWLAGVRRTTRGDRDAVAAAIILQSYLDSLEAGAGDQSC